MCATCGCGSGAKATILNLETGTVSAMGDDDPQTHAHDHEHDDEDGTRHAHPHAHGHGHGHAHGQGEQHSHAHVHPDGTRHGHPHEHDGEHSHADDRTHEHEHGHADGTRNHPHEHGHDHLHGHSHGHSHDHEHADGTRHSHSHEHDGEHSHEHEHTHADGTRHSHAPTRSGGDVVALEAQVLAKNDALAATNRAWFKGREILALNLVSSPGAGKTSLLERTIRDLKDEMALFVIEGDQATANDGERIRAAGAAAVQVNTGTGCHLEADMVMRGLRELQPGAGSVVMIENVGNLVCPALFDLGERAKVVVLSVTEGEDKPLKYPHMFRAAQIMILNKIDLLPHLDFDVECVIANARQVNSDIVCLQVSARTGEGLPEWYRWLRREATSPGTFR